MRCPDWRQSTLTPEPWQAPDKKELPPSLPLRGPGSTVASPRDLVQVE